MGEDVIREGNTLPPGWVWTTLGEITQPIEKVDPTQEPDREFIYLDIASIDNSIQRITDPKRYQGAEAPSRARQRVKTGDVLFSTVRTYLKNIASVPAIYDGQIASTGFSILRGKDGVLSQYLFYYCLTDDLLSALAELQRGTSYPAVRDGDVRAQRVPLAPLPEQRRIVAEIEKQFTRLDAGVAALKRVQANLKRYRASVLKAACEGRLAPQDPADEPADRLLARILVERRAKWEAEHPGKKYVEPGAPVTDGLPKLPVGWCWARVEQLAEVVRGASPRPAGNPKYFGGNIPWITVGYLTADEQPYLTSVNTFVTEAGREKSRYVESDTLLLTNSGATLGVPKITKIGGCFNDGVVALLHVEQPLRLYLYYFLKSITRKLRAINQGAAQPNLNTGIVNAIVLPLPPSAEQHRIIAEVERRLSVVAELEATVAANLARAGRLRQAVLKRAFEGRLVAQDARDGPTSYPASVETR